MAQQRQRTAPLAHRHHCHTQRACAERGQAERAVQCGGHQQHCAGEQHAQCAEPAAFGQRAMRRRRHQRLRDLAPMHPAQHQRRVQHRIGQPAQPCIGWHGQMEPLRWRSNQLIQEHAHQAVLRAAGRILLGKVGRVLQQGLHEWSDRHRSALRWQFRSRPGFHEHHEAVRPSTAAGAMSQPTGDPDRALWRNHPQASRGLQHDQATRGDQQLRLPMRMEGHLPGIWNRVQPKHHHRKIDTVRIVGPNLAQPRNRNLHAGTYAPKPRRAARWRLLVIVCRSRFAPVPDTDQPHQDMDDGWIRPSCFGSQCFLAHVGILSVRGPVA